jgi:hypothetical protein
MAASLRSDRFSAYWHVGIFNMVVFLVMISAAIQPISCVELRSFVSLYKILLG